MKLNDNFIFLIFVLIFHNILLFYDKGWNGSNAFFEMYSHLFKSFVCLVGINLLKVRKVTINQWKLMKINKFPWENKENRSKSMQIYKNEWTSIKFSKNQYKSVKIYENQWNSMKFNENQGQSVSLINKSWIKESIARWPTLESASIWLIEIF